MEVVNSKRGLNESVADETERPGIGGRNIYEASMCRPCHSCIYTSTK